MEELPTASAAINNEICAGHVGRRVGAKKHDGPVVLVYTRHAMERDQAAEMFDEFGWLSVVHAAWRDRVHADAAIGPVGR